MVVNFHNFVALNTPTQILIYNIPSSFWDLAQNGE